MSVEITDPQDKGNYLADMLAEALRPETRWQRVDGLEQTAGLVGGNLALVDGTPIMTEALLSELEALEPADLREAAGVYSREEVDISLAVATNPLSDRIEVLEDNQISGRATFETWAALSAVAGAAGQGAEVVPADSGTHTDPVAGGTVKNAGLFVWSVSPAGWKRVGDGLSAMATTEFVNRRRGEKGSDIASASSIDLSAATGDYVDITGTVTISSLGTVAAGVERTLRFMSALTLTHSSALVLPGSANIVTANGDTAIFRSEGSGNWRCISYMRASGQALTSDPTKLSQDDIRSLYSITRQTLGRAVDPVTGSASGTSIFVFANPSTLDGELESISLFVLSTGTISGKLFTKSGTTFTQKSAFSFEASATGLHTFTKEDFGDVAVAAGDYVGLVGGKWSYSSTGADGSGWYQFSASASSVTNPSLVVSPRLEISIVIAELSDEFAANAEAFELVRSDLDETIAAAELLKQHVTQAIGLLAGVTPTTGSAISTQHYVCSAPVAHDGLLESYTFFAMATGTLKLERWSLVSGTLTLVETVNVTISATGLQTLTPSDFGTVKVYAGDLLGIYGTGIVAFTNVSGQAYYLVPGTSGSASSTSNSGYTFQHRFAVGADVQTVTAEAMTSALGNASGGGSMTLANVDKIAIVGNSYNEFLGGLLGKAPVCLLSSLSEYNFGNFSQGGATAANIATNIANRVSKFGSTFASLKATYAVFMEYENSKAQTDAAYFADVQKVIDVIKGLGCTPILASEWGGAGKTTVDGEQSRLRGLRALADANGLRTIDVTSKSRTMNPTQYGAFWKSNHPGTRTTWLLIDGLRRGLKQLPRPLRSLKIFRVRGTVTVSTVADLLFRSVSERHRLFREIYIGHSALSEAQKVNYDVVSSLYDGNQTQADEYVSLAGGSALSLGSYALIDAVLPVEDAKGVTLTISDTAATVYARRMTASGASWVQLTLEGGTFIVPDDSGLIDRDRVAFLVYRSGGLSLAGSPKIAWNSGRQRNPAAPSPLLFAAPTGAEMLAQPLTVVSSAVPAAWVNSGSLPAVTPADGILPTGTTGCVEVTNSAGLDQAMSYASSDDPREVTIRVWARRWVDAFAPASDFATAPITYETCDTATLQVTVHGATGITSASAVLKDQVGLHWGEYEFRATLEALTTAASIDVRSADSAIQIAKVSVKQAFA